MSHIRLPFFADPSSLPAPLPTHEVILASQDVLQEYSGRRIVRVGPHYVVKHGYGVSLTEGVTMLFVREATSVPVPIVYALYSRQEEGHPKPTNYIVMENVAGGSLMSRWATLGPAEKSAITDTLRGYLMQLRRIPSPGYFGMVERRPFENSVFLTPSSDFDEHVRRIFYDPRRPEVPPGPFDTEQQLIDSLVLKAQHVAPDRSKFEYYRRILPRVLRSSQGPVFTHADFQRKNVVIRDDDGTPVIIDWEASGWYPSYWEYSMAIISCRWNDDWHSSVAKILDECPAEYPTMAMLYSEICS